MEKAFVRGDKVREMNPRRLSDPFPSWPDLYEFVQPSDEWSVVETKKLLFSEEGQLQLTRQTTTLHLLKMDYSCCSIAFGARELVVHSAKSNGVVCRDVKRHCFASFSYVDTDWRILQ